ncbi:MAG: hypothetical protein IPM00_04355 [Tetrasphaera sp.]|nr:hypothetical protein [Tetrasphaera sp.]
MTAASTTTAPTPPHAGRRLELVIAAQRWSEPGACGPLTHRAVDADAGLPEGSCSSYYRTKVALLGALTEHIGHQLRVSVLDLGGRLDVVHARHPDGQERTDAVVGEVVALFERWLDEAGPGRHPGRARSRGIAPARTRRPHWLRWRAGLVDVVAGLPPARAGVQPRPGRRTRRSPRGHPAGRPHARGRRRTGESRARGILTDAVLLVLTPLA